MGFKKISSLPAQLLPGIPDEVTLDQITPNLEWREFCRLSSMSRSWQQAVHQACDNKLVLTFDKEGTPELVKDWIEEFNQTSLHKLSYSDQLVNDLYVVNVESTNPDLSESTLLLSSPLQALEVYASVNTFSPNFNPENPAVAGNFKQLLTVVICTNYPFRNEVIFDVLDLVLQPVGRIITRSKGSGLESYKITALVETTNTRIVPEVTLDFGPDPALGPPRFWPVLFDYLGLPPLRCQRCHSYDHKDC